MNLIQVRTHPAVHFQIVTQKLDATEKFNWFGPFQGLWLLIMLRYVHASHAAREYVWTNPSLPRRHQSSCPK